MVVVNLRPETDPETDYVVFDRPRVLRVLDRIIADLDDLAGYPQIADEEQAKIEDPKARHARHRRRQSGARPAAEAVERPGRTGGLMGRSGPSASRAEVSPTRVGIGIGPFPSRGGLGKGPLNGVQSRLCQSFRRESSVFLPRKALSGND